MTLTRAQFDDCLTIMSHPETDFAHYRDNLAKIYAHDAALRARVEELEKAEDHYQKTILGLDDKLAALTAERDRLAAQLASVVQPSHE